MRQVGGISEMGYSDAVIEGCDADTEVTPEALDRCLQLLTKWAVRRGQEVLGNAGIDPENLVTGADIKTYGDNDRGN